MRQAFALLTMLVTALGPGLLAPSPAHARLTVSI
jgi:hypothetical protein